MGQVKIQIIVTRESAVSITEVLREKGYAVTTMEAQGRDSEKTVLMIVANRKGKGEIINEIQQLDRNAVIITNDISTLHGGTIPDVRRLLK